MALHPSVVRDAARQLEAAARRLRNVAAALEENPDLADGIPAEPAHDMRRALSQAQSLIHAAVARINDGPRRPAPAKARMERCASSLEGHAETLVHARRHFVHDGTGGGEYVDNPDYVHVKIGDTVTQHVAAPGTGCITYRITRLDNQGAWGVILASTVRELTAAEVQ